MEGLLGKRWQTHALIIVAYTLLALALTWPLAAHFGSHVPGNGVDDPPLTWNLWWVRYTFLSLGTNPFDCDYLFYPLGINLAFYTLTVLNGLLSLPLQAVLGLIPASNLLLLSSFVLSGYGAFLLSLYLLSGSKIEANSTSEPQSSVSALYSLLPSFAAGLLYAFASSKLAYAALGQWNIASSQWIPFYVLYLLKMGKHPERWRYPLLATLFLLFQAYAELTYATFLVLFTALCTVWLVVAYVRFRQSRRLWRTVLNLVGVGLLFAVGLVPILAMMLPDMLVEGDIFVEGGGFADVFSADLIGYLVPTRYHPLFGSLVDLFDFDHSVGQHLYVGYSLLAIVVVAAVYGWRRGRLSQTFAAARHPETPAPLEGGRELVPPFGVGFWLLSTVVFWLLTLGPTLRINGQDTGLPLPFALMAQLPFLQGNRYPSRYSVMLFLSLAILVALGLAAILQRKGRRPATASLAVCLFLIIFLLFEHLSVPLPLSDMSVPPIYYKIAGELPGDATLLDLPVAWRNGFRVTGTQHPTIMFQQYYQSVHGKRILAGNTSRNPPLKFQYFTEAPVINTLIALETGHQVEPAIIERDKALSPDVLRFLNVEAILVHPAQTGPDMIPYIEAAMPVERWEQDEQIVAYRLNLPSWPETWTIEPGDELGRLSYAEGWGVPAGGVVWAQRRAARLLVPLDGSEQAMVFRAYAPEGGQRLEIEVNGRTVDWIGMAAGWLDYEVTLPASAVRPGLNELWLRFETLYPAGQVTISPRTIGQTGFESPVNLVVQSAGQEVGDFGHIYIDGQDVSPNERGYNLAVLDPQSGAVEFTAAFDTHLDEGASRALADFLSEVPEGSIVAVAASDEASRLLDGEAVAALRGIGAVGDLREKFRWGHAIIGVQGAPPGSAAEAMDWMRPVQVAAGEGTTEPHLAAAFATMTFTAISGP